MDIQTEDCDISSGFCRSNCIMTIRGRIIIFLNKKKYCN
jgi:hypothetical protein